MIFSVAVTMACATTKDKKTATSEYAAFKNVSANDSLFASIERGFCFGKCPVYKLHIYNSGYATYEGIRNVDTIGLFSGKFTVQQMNDLLSGAKGISFFSMQETYDNPNVTDLPMGTISLVSDAKRHQVKYRVKFPQEIKILEAAFEDMVREVSWK